MIRNLDLRVVKNKQIDKELVMKIIHSGSGERIFVEFSTKDGKLVLQKSFQNTVDGKKDSKKFQDSIKSTKELRDYFGLNKKERKCR